MSARSPAPAPAATGSLSASSRATPTWSATPSWAWRPGPSDSFSRPDWSLEQPIRARERVFCLPLPTDEVCLPWSVLEERRDADAGVLGREHLGEQVLLQGEAGVERPLQPAVDRTLGQPLRNHRTSGQLPRKSHRPCVQLVGRHHLVDKSDTQRLVGGDLAT